MHALGLLAVWHVYVVAGVYGLLMMIALAAGRADLCGAIAGALFPLVGMTAMIAATAALVGRLG